MIKISSVIFLWTIQLGQLFLLTCSVPCIVHPPKHYSNSNSFITHFILQQQRIFRRLDFKCFFSLSLIKIHYYEENRSFKLEVTEILETT